MNFDDLIASRNSRNDFNRMIGARVVGMSEGHALVELALAEAHFNIWGSVHGGCLFTLADSACGVACLSYGVKSVTMSANIQYLNAAIGAKKLIAQATVLKRGRRVIVTECEIRDDQNRLIAKATMSNAVLGPAEQ